MTAIDNVSTQIIPRVPAVDETGGLELFIDMLDLRTKRDATAEQLVIVEPDDEQDSDAPASSPQPVLQPAQSHGPGLWRRALTRVKAAVRMAVATVREAKAWLFSEFPSVNPRLITRFKNRYLTPKGRHHVRRAWYGVQRSTAASVVITRERHMRAQQTSRTKEGVLSSYFDLPEYWTSHMARLIETIREEHSIFHPSTGRHWECS